MKGSEEREKRGELPFLLKTEEPTDTISKINVNCI